MVESLRDGAYERSFGLWGYALEKHSGTRFPSFSLTIKHIVLVHHVLSAVMCCLITEPKTTGLIDHGLEPPNL